MTEYKCGYEGLCNMQHPITDVYSSNLFGKGCLLNNCIKETNYYLPILEKSDENTASSLEKNVKSE